MAFLPGMLRRTTAKGALVLLAAASGPVPVVRANFQDVTAGTGIAYVHAVRGTAVSKGQGGLAAVDVNGDGWPDLLGARLGATPVLYVNQQNGRFTEEATARGLDVAVNASAFAAADFENRGRADLFVVPEKGSRFFYFVNDGSGHFTEEAVERGAAVPTSLEDHEAFSVSVVDYDRDGYLDVYVCEWGPANAAEWGLHSVLLRNRGSVAPGHFENVTTAAGLLQSPALKPFHVNPDGKPQQTTFSAAWADFDEDGWPDLMLVADFGASRMYWNNGNGTFTEGTVASGAGLDENGMGAAVADFDGDGRLDVFVSSIYDELLASRSATNTGNKLYRNLGHRRFAEVSKTAGVDRSGWSWGAAFLDYNNRGTQDLIVTNGMDGVQQGGPTGIYHDALTDQTALFQNDDTGRFVNVATLEGITDRGLGKGLVVWDFDHDGALDLAIADTYSGPLIYRNTTAIGNKWLRLTFRGAASNRDGIGAVVRVTTEAKTQTLLYNPTLAYLGTREAGLHVGLGNLSGAIDRVEVTWPSGVVQTLSGVAPNQFLTLDEPAVPAVAPVFTVQPAGGSFTKDHSVVLTAAANGTPVPVFTWRKDGVIIAGANGPTLTFSRVHPFDAGSYTVDAINTAGMVSSEPAVIAVTLDLGSHSVARWWDEFLLDGIRKDTPNPPVHARNLYHLSAALWDAFWPYQEEGWSQASPVFVREVVTAADWTGGREAAQRQAMSHAAYRVLTERFKTSPGQARTLFGCRWLMQRLGYDPDDASTTGHSPAAVGNRIGLGVLAATRDDGANEAAGYADATGYEPANDPMIVALPGTTMADPSRWQRLALRHSVTQNGITEPDSVQNFVGVNARNTQTFALLKPTATTVDFDPGPPPRFGGETHAAFVQEALDCLQPSAMLDPSDGVLVDISPGRYLHNPLGTNDGVGHALNPFTGRAYAANVVKRGDYARVLAEFWADGPASETPPGHWNVLLNEVADDPVFVRKFGGAGPVLPALEWDVRAYLALNGAVHDAACAAWTLKRQYDSARPISIIRYLGGLGQSSNPEGPSYHERGLPLIPNLIEVVTAQSAAPGQRHAHLADKIGKIAVRTWQGSPADPQTQTGGVGWIPAERWVPYQMPTFVTPAFPGFVSGHSTFSRSAAEVLTLLSGSSFFPGGLGEYAFDANHFLAFETGPTADLTLQWATFYDAADQAGLSRLYGGIHSSIDDLTGRRLGSRIGLEAFLKAQALRRASAPAAGLVNVSSRGRSGLGDDVMIAGFVIEGAAPQAMLLRAVGPELENYGIAANRCEPDPSLELHRAGESGILLQNDNWGASSHAGQIAGRATTAGAFSLTTASRDAAEITDLAGGTYSVVVRSADPVRRGVVLAEVYGQRLSNLSTRGSVGHGDDVLIAGFVLDAPDPTPLLIRVLGPTLTDLAVKGTLSNPVLSVYRKLPDGSSQFIASNDNWSDDEKASLIQNAAAHAGAYPIASGSRDAALFLQLPAGVYNAVASSADASEGVALVEVYHVK